MDKSIIKVRSMSFKYADKYIFKDFDMDIDLSNEELEEVLEALEGELKKYEKILKILVEDKVEKEVPKANSLSQDEIIRKFLRGIM